MQPPAREAYWDVHEVLEDLRTVETISITFLRRMYSAIDQLRELGAPAKHLSLAEKITVAVHRLEASRRRQDSKGEAAACKQLDQLIADWFEIPLSGDEGSGKASSGKGEATKEAGELEPVSIIGQTGRFKQFQRGDGSPVACQVSRVLYVAKGDHGAILHFGGGTQLNIRHGFEEVLEAMNSDADE